jgi:hypothetical protein
MDFQFDEVCGPVLVTPDVTEILVRSATGSREPRRNGNLGIRKDALDHQETRQDERLARMAGHLPTHSHSLEDHSGMEAGQDPVSLCSLPREES